MEMDLAPDALSRLRGARALLPSRRRRRRPARRRRSSATRNPRRSSTPRRSASRSSSPTSSATWARTRAATASTCRSTSCAHSASRPPTSSTRATTEGFAPSDGVPGRARAKAYYERALALLPPEDRKAAAPGLIMAAIYSHAARRDRARRLPRAAPAHRADAAAQAVDRVEDLGFGVTAATAHRRDRRRLGRMCRRGGLRACGTPSRSCSKRAANSAAARAGSCSNWTATSHARQRPASADRRVYRRREAARALRCHARLGLRASSVRDHLSGRHVPACREAAGTVASGGSAADCAWAPVAGPAGARAPAAAAEGTGVDSRARPRRRTLAARVAPDAASDGPHLAAADAGCPQHPA